MAFFSFFFERERAHLYFFQIFIPFISSPRAPWASLLGAKTPWLASTACGCHCMCLVSPLVSYGLLRPCESLRWRVTHTYPRQICASHPAKSNNSLYIADVQPNIFGLKRCGCFLFFFVGFFFSAFSCSNPTKSSKHSIIKFSVLLAETLKVYFIPVCTDSHNTFLAAAAGAVCILTRWPYVAL